MDEMLRGITAASAAASNPLLRAFLGPSASAADYEAAAREAEALWAQLDSMAEQDPDAYRDFISQQAAEARREAEAGRDPHVEGLAPALVLEAQATTAAAAAAAGGGGAGGGPAVDLARVVPGGQAVARVHIWAANDASGLRPPTLAGGAPLPSALSSPSSSAAYVSAASYASPTSPAYTSAAPSAATVSPTSPAYTSCAPSAAATSAAYASAAYACPVNWSGLTLPIAEYRPAATRAGGPLPLHLFHVAVHASAVRGLAAAYPGGGLNAPAAALRAGLLEAVCQFVESEYRLSLSRTVRTLHVHREALTEAELRALTEADAAARARQPVAATAVPAVPAAAAPLAGGAAADGATDAESGLPPSLLQQLRSLGSAVPPPAASGRRQQPLLGQGQQQGEQRQGEQGRPAAAGATPAAGKARKKPLIEELD